MTPDLQAQWGKIVLANQDVPAIQAAAAELERLWAVSLDTCGCQVCERQRAVRAEMAKEGGK